jgi:excisionase family DNA binding protein
MPMYMGTVQNLQTMQHRSAIMQTEQPLSTGKVAKILGASVEAVNSWIRAGKLKAYRTPGGHYRVAPQDLASFSEETGAWTDPEFRLETVARILIVDDEPGIRDFVVDALAEEYEVSLATGGLEACLKCGEIRPDILITDLRMPDASGYDVVRMIRDRYAEPMRVIVMTAYPYDEEAEQIKRMGIDGFLQKPFDLSELKTLVYSLDGSDGAAFTPPPLQ